ncbi:DUF1996 domain-containing protein [Patescibacteria group bacterium]|nr:MAG: DUF1996 domain-containing protein [Patescibacteria group bacterium]
MQGVDVMAKKRGLQLTKKKGPIRDSNGKFVSGSGGLRQLNFNWKRMLPVVLVITAVGGFFIYRGSAATALLALPGSESGKQDCAAASGTVVKESSGQKRNYDVCQLSNGSTLAPVRFGGDKVKATNVTQYLSETQKLTGGQRNMQVCYNMKIASGTSASVNMGGYVEGGSPMGGHAHPLNTGDYQKYCDPNLYASNTRVFITVTSGTVRVSSITITRSDGSTPPSTECEGPNITMNLCLNPASIPQSPTGQSAQKTAPGYAPEACGPVGNETCGNRAAAFRTNCKFSHMSKNDAIVFPGVTGRSHWHTFFGNTAADQNLTNPSTQGNSNCEGGSLNRTAYWAPTLVDTNSYNTKTKQFDAVPPMHENDGSNGFPIQVYYKAGFRGVRANDIQWFPQGLRMIAGGNPSVAPAGPVSPGDWDKVVYFDCITWGDAQSYSGNIKNRNEIPKDCPAGRYIQATVVFPQCGARNSDGSPRLDSPDHRSHMSYPVTNSSGNWAGCPSTHPIPYPEITEHFRWKVPAGGASGLRFAPDIFYDKATPNSPVPQPGWTFHADWFNGWNDTATNAIIKNCFQSGGTAGSDCGMNNLGTRDSAGRWMSLSF